MAPFAGDAFDGISRRRRRSNVRRLSLNRNVRGLLMRSLRRSRGRTTRGRQPGPIKPAEGFVLVERAITFWTLLQFTLPKTVIMRDKSS